MRKTVRSGALILVIAGMCGSVGTQLSHLRSRETEGHIFSHLRFLPNIASYGLNTERCAIGEHSVDFADCCMQGSVPSHCRLLRVELGVPLQQSLLRSKAAKAHSKQGRALVTFQSGGVKDTADEPASRDDRMLKELQAIAAALQEIKAGGAVGLGRAGMAC